MSCSQLFLDDKATNANFRSAEGSSENGVCALPKGQASCSVKNRPFLDAESHCEAKGMRLCSQAEYEAGDGAGSGCLLDKQPVWTSTVCSGGHVAVQLNKKPGDATSQCLSDTSTSGNGGRCCADVDIQGRCT